jgi:hypothetical protein
MRAFIYLSKDKESGYDLYVPSEEGAYTSKLNPSTLFQEILYLLEENDIVVHNKDDWEIAQEAALYGVTFSYSILFKSVSTESPKRNMLIENDAARVNVEFYLEEDEELASVLQEVGEEPYVIVLPETFFQACVRKPYIAIGHRKVGNKRYVALLNAKVPPDVEVINMTLPRRCESPFKSNILFLSEKIGRLLGRDIQLSI